MALVTVGELKEYLKEPSGPFVADALIERLRRSAIALIETYLATLTAQRTSAGGGTWAAIRSFRLHNEAGGTTTLTSVASLEEQPDYLTRIEPALNQDITDVVAHLYAQRSPTASSETEGGGVSSDWDDVGDSGLPKRVERRIRNLVATLA
jgi:hypothetical protein